MRDKIAKTFLAFSLNLLGYKKRVTFLNVCCNAVIFCRMAAITYIVRQVLNLFEASGGSALRQALPYLLMIPAVIGIRIIAIMGCAVLDTFRAYYYQNRTRQNLLRLLLGKENITEVAGHSGRIFEILDKDIAVSTFPAELLTEVTGYFIFTLIALSMMLSINWQLTLFIFIPLSAAIWLIQKLTDRIREKRRASRAAQDAASSFTGDVAETVLAVKAAGACEPVLRQYDRVNKNRRSVLLKDTLLNSRIGVLLDGSVHVGTAIMMFAAARLMTGGPGGNFGLGDFSLFITYLGTLADCVNRIVELIVESRKAEVLYERILNAAGPDNGNELCADAGITLGSGRAGAGSVGRLGPAACGDLSHSAGSARRPGRWRTFEVRNLSYDHGEGKGFKNISFKLAPGEILAITGEIGSGKSTLMNVLTGLLPPDSGMISMDEKIISPANRESGIIAGAPQRGGFFSGTVRDNISLGSGYSDAEITEALSLAALDELSGCLDTDPGSGGVMLSGGQRQRLSLARMYVRGACVYVIDDCISALDENTRLKVLENLKNHLKNADCAVIMAVNEEVFINAADRVLYMGAPYA